MLLVVEDRSSVGHRTIGKGGCDELQVERDAKRPAVKLAGHVTRPRTQRQRVWCHEIWVRCVHSTVAAAEAGLRTRAELGVVDAIRRAERPREQPDAKVRHFVERCEARRGCLRASRRCVRQE